jgi:hypothetical protein
VSCCASWQKQLCPLPSPSPRIAPPNTPRTPRGLRFDCAEVLTSLALYSRLVQQLFLTEDEVRSLYKSFVSVPVTAKVPGECAWC